jgi:hypothetical protein
MKFKLARRKKKFDSLQPALVWANGEIAVVQYRWCGDATMKNKLSNVNAFPSSKEQRKVRYDLLENEFVGQEADSIFFLCGLACR